MIKITSAENKFVKLAVSLKNKKYRLSNQLFLLEGARNIDEIININLKDIICFVNINDFSLEALTILKEKTKKLNWAFYEIDEKVYNKIKDTQNSQGLICIVPFKKNNLEDLNVNATTKLVYLEKIQDPGNLGTIIRTVSATNCEGVILSKDCVDLYNEKTIRSTMGAIFKIPIITDISLTKLKTFSIKNNLQLFGSNLNTNKFYHQLNYQKATILLFGNEGNGLSNEAVSLCEETFKIPMKKNVESLNLATSVAIVLYKVWEQEGFKI